MEDSYHKIIATTEQETPELFRTIYVSPDKKNVFVSLEGFAMSKGEILSAITEFSQGKDILRMIFVDAHYYIDADWFLKNTPVSEERYIVVNKIKEDMIAYVADKKPQPTKGE